MAKLHVLGDWHGPGEEKAARQLAESLPEQGDVVAGRNVPSGMGTVDLDLVVVGERAVFVCEEKAWGRHVVTGEVSWYANGEPRHSPVNQVAHAARVLDFHGDMAPARPAAPPGSMRRRACRSPVRARQPRRDREPAWQLSEVIGYVCGLGEIQRNVVYEDVRAAYEKHGYGARTAPPASRRWTSWPPSPKPRQLRLAVVLDEPHRLARDVTLPKIMNEGRKYGGAECVEQRGHQGCLPVQLPAEPDGCQVPAGEGWAGHGGGVGAAGCRAGVRLDAGAGGGARKVFMARD